MTRTDTQYFLIVGSRRSVLNSMRILDQPVHLSDRWMSSLGLDQASTPVTSAQTDNEAGPVPVPQGMMGKMASGKLL